MSFIFDPGKKILKKIAKKLKKLKKTSFRHYFLPKRDEIGRERKKKILLPNSVHIRPGQENSEKNRKKKVKKLKNLFPTLFLAKTVGDRPRKRKKKFTPEFRSYSTQARKFRKK